MKFYIVAIVFSIFFINGFSQQFINLKEGGAVTCVAYWAKKDAVVYHVDQTEQLFKNGKDSPYKSTKTEYDINLRVIDSVEKAYTVDLTYSNFYTDNQKPDTDFELLKLFSKLHIKYKTSELGEFIEIINKKEIAESMGPLIDKLHKDFETKAKNGDEKESLALVFDNMKQFFTNEQNVEGLFAGDIYYIHSFYGIKLHLNKEEEIPIEYPTIGNIKLGGTGKLMLTEANKAKGECKIQLGQQPDKGALNEYAKKLLVTILGDFSKKAKRDFAQLNFSANTKLKYIMDLSSGWFKKISSTSNATITVDDESVRSVSKTTMIML